MRFWRRRKKTTTSRTTLQIESLEDRSLLNGGSIIPLVSGETLRFLDADGSKVTVRLSGPGSGTLTLTNGATTGGDIERLTLSGTTGNTQLKITAKRGSIAGTTIALGSDPPSILSTRPTQACIIC